MEVDSPLVGAEEGDNDINAKESEASPMEIDSPLDTNGTASGYADADSLSDDDSTLDESNNRESVSIDDALDKSSILKEAGNACFKSGDYKDAKDKYECGLKLLKDHKKKKAPVITESQVQSVQNMYITLKGNLGMVLLKEENWNAVAKNTKEIVEEDPKNVKALYRRAVAYHKLGKLEDSKSELQHLLEIDPANNAAKKELSEVVKSIKEYQSKQKAAYTGMFKTGIYDDREKERKAKLKAEEEAKMKEQDDWVKSKIERRAKGLEEQSFEDWKKEKEENEKKEREQKRLLDKAAKAQRNRKQENKSDDDDIYDDEDNKILNETKKKGYCYFRRELSEQDKNLIGDIKPKTIRQQEEEPMEIERPLPKADQSSLEASCWNSAGTWEERDMTQHIKDRLSKLTNVSIHQAGGADALKSMENALKSIENSISADGIEKLSNSLANIDGSILEVEKNDGEAQIVLTRGKKRHIYDFTLKLKFEITLSDPVSLSDAEDESRKKKFKGTFEISDINPQGKYEYRVLFKKQNVPERAEKAADTLLKEVFKELDSMAQDYLKM